ncbi:MAG: NAD(P)/FAD-dependent oxidoreductase [Patescibacteria group bacterium]|jgi:hypothetical protein
MKYNLIVIGGGPAGIMAAIRAGELGARVLFLEKNKSLGVKLLLTGNGRCNITNNILDSALMTKKFGVKGKFLLSAFSRFGVLEVLNFFEKNKVPLQIEDEGKVFPKSSQAKDVLNALLLCLKENKVEIKTNAEVKKLIKNSENKISKIVLVNGEELEAEKYIIATGGKSYAFTGSNGCGYEWLEKLGHKIIPLRPVLSPIEVKENFIKEIEGASLSDVEVFLILENKKIASEIGDVIFTANGLSGPAIINLSRFVGEELEKKKSLSIKIDFVPKLDLTSLDKKIENDLQVAGAQMLKNYLNNFLPPKMILRFIFLTGIGSEKKCRDITRVERKKIISLLKGFPLMVQGVSGYERAMLTAGGVDLKEVDPKTMRSKIITNLYLAGEILDLNGPTGGYNLQVAWSTGYVAGSL